MAYPSKLMDSCHSFIPQNFWVQIAPSVFIFFSNTYSYHYQWQIHVLIRFYILNHIHIERKMPLITRKPNRGRNSWRKQKHQMANQDQWITETAGENGAGTNGWMMGYLVDTCNCCHGCHLSQNQSNQERQPATQLNWC